MSEASKRQEGGEYYKKNKIQPWDVIEAWELDFWLGNLVKYIFRAATNVKESPRLNLKKGAHYLEKKLELVTFEQRQRINLCQSGQHCDMPATCSANEVCRIEELNR